MRESEEKLEVLEDPITVDESLREAMETLDIADGDAVYAPKPEQTAEQSTVPMVDQAAQVVPDDVWRPDGEIDVEAVLREAMGELPKQGGSLIVAPAVAESIKVEAGWSVEPGGVVDQRINVLSSAARKLLVSVQEDASRLSARNRPVVPLSPERLASLKEAVSNTGVPEWDAIVKEIAEGKLYRTNELSPKPSPTNSVLYSGVFSPRLFGALTERNKAHSESLTPEDYVGYCLGFLSYLCLVEMLKRGSSFNDINAIFGGTHEELGVTLESVAMPIDNMRRGVTGGSTVFDVRQIVDAIAIPIELKEEPRPETALMDAKRTQALKYLMGLLQLSLHDVKVVATEFGKEEKDKDSFSNSLQCLVLIVRKSMEEHNPDYMEVMKRTCSHVMRLNDEDVTFSKDNKMSVVLKEIMEAVVETYPEKVRGLARLEMNAPARRSVEQPNAVSCSGMIEEKAPANTEALTLASTDAFQPRMSRTRIALSMVLGVAIVAGAGYVGDLTLGNGQVLNVGADAGVSRRGVVSSGDADEQREQCCGENLNDRCVDAGMLGFRQSCIPEATPESPRVIVPIGGVRRVMVQTRTK